MLNTYLLNEDTPGEMRASHSHSMNWTTEIPNDTCKATTMGPIRTTPLWDSARKPYSVVSGSICRQAALRG